MIYSTLLFFFFFADGPELDCPSTYTAPEFSVNNMSCTVAGFPTPVVTWYKEYDDVELPEILTRRDSGQYTIHAVNNVSSVNVTVELIVNCRYIYLYKSVRFLWFSM